MSKENIDLEYNVIKVRDPDEFRKSNFIISSVYKRTMLENKILQVALNRIPQAREDKEGSLIVTMTADELKSKFKLRGRSIYENLETAARKMTTGQSIGFSDPETESFSYVALINKVEYKNKELTVRFPPEMKKFIKDLNGNFTILSLETMLSFRSVYSLRLYEILKSQSYAPANVYVNEDTIYQIEMSVYELMLKLGAVNAELAKVKNELLKLDKDGKPDYEKAVKVADEKMYQDYHNFKRSCIDKAVKEINEKTELRVTVDTTRAGKGGKTKSIKFFVKKLKNKKPGVEEVSVVEKKEIDIDDFHDMVRECTSEKIKTSEARAISNAAGYDIDIIKKADEYVQTKDYDSYVAYMVETIKNRWYEKPNVVTKGGASKSKKSRVVDVKEDEIVNLDSANMITVVPGRKRTKKELEEELCGE